MFKNQAKLKQKPSKHQATTNKIKQNKANIKIDATKKWIFKFSNNMLYVGQVHNVQACYRYVKDIS